MSRALPDVCTVSASRPAVNATDATRASTAARRWNGEALLRTRSLAWASTSPTRAQASARQYATELAGAIPLGAMIRQPMTTAATVNPKTTTCSSLKDVTTRAGTGAVAESGLPTSTWTSSRTAMVRPPRTGRPR